MTTEALRKVIKVTYWMIGEKGLSISYERSDLIPVARHLILPPVDVLRELSVVGSIDKIGAMDMTIACINGIWNTYQEMILVYKMCQWEALSIVIRHEEEKELANDMNILEMDAAIAALNNF